MDIIAQVPTDHLGVIAFHLLLIWPMARIYRRVGLHPGWSVLAVLPLVGLACVLAPLALKPWPLAPAARPDRQRG